MFQHFERSSPNLHQDEDNDVSAIIQQITYGCNTVSQSESLNESVLEGSESKIIYTRVPRDRDATSTRTNRDVSQTYTSPVHETKPGSDCDDDEYDDVSVGDVFEEIRQTYGNELQATLSAYKRNNSKDIDTDNIENYVDNIFRTKQTEELNISCATCCKPRRVERASWLERGQHIRFPGKYLTCRLKKQLIPVYYHHAIIKEVKNVANNSVELVLIHFKKENQKISICRTIETYNLEKDDIEIIEYERPRYDAVKIVRRAESMLHEEGDTTDRKEFESYNIIYCNCEHFASWCVVGEGVSFQEKSAKKKIAKILSTAAGVASKSGRFFAKVLYTASDEIAAGLNLGDILPGVLLGASAFSYLIYTIAMTISYRRKYSKGNMCKVCFKREVISLWTSFGAYSVTSGLSYILVHFLLPLLAPTLVGIPLLLVLVLMCIFLQWGLGKVAKALMSPYACDIIEVKRLSQITPGSMISFKYFGISHVAIVTKKHDESEDSLTGIITCVHYGIRGINLFSKRKVIEDSFRLDVKDNEKDVRLVDCTALKTCPPEVVVSRVRARIGEKKWSPFTNRSDHLCFYCLVNEEYGQENQTTTEEDSACQTHPKRKSSLYLGTREIHLRSELEVGQIVKYLGNTGIVVYLEDCTKENQQNFRMELIVYENYSGTRILFMVDLKRKNLYIEKYHPAHCYPIAERVRRACKREDECCEYWRQYSFLESCILKEK